MHDQYRIQEELNQLIAGFQRNNVAMSMGYSPMTVGCPNLSFDMLFKAKLAQDNMELVKQQRIIHQILNSSSKAPAQTMPHYPPTRGNPKRDKNSFNIPKSHSYIELPRHHFIDKSIVAAQTAKTSASLDINSFISNGVAAKKKEAPLERVPLYLRKPSSKFASPVEEKARPKARISSPPPPSKTELSFIMQVVEGTDKEVEDFIKNFPPIRN